MTAYDDLLPEGPEAGRAVLLPGRVLGPSRPLFDAVTDALLAHGWAVRRVRWEVPEGLPTRRATPWVTAQLVAAADGWSEQPLVVGKSLGSRAAGYAARHSLDAVWLTPLLLDRGVRRALRRNRARQLLVGGTADGLAWDSSVAHSLGVDVLELPDADHSLVIKDDPERTSAYRDRLRAAVETWIQAGR